MPTPSPLDDHIALLDDLIGITYSAVAANITQTAKIGDFLKMLELRRKLSPGPAGQKELLDLLNNIRKDLSLPSGASDTSTDLGDSE